MNGTWKTDDTWGGIKSGMVGIGPFADFVPKDVVAMAEKTIEDIKSGALHPFQGPIKDQSGKLVVKEGEVIPDGELLGMNWYVEGVDGKLPK
jgi:simple sugar transport system substrate-binding protein